MSRPSEALGDSRTRVLLAVVNGGRTYAELIEATGLSRQPLHAHLHALRDDGLVAFEDRTLGTLRPLVTEVSPATWGNSDRMGSPNTSGPGECVNTPRTVARPTEEV